jgi:hypothetical protein
MAIVEIILTVLTAFFVGILFYYVFKSSGPWGTFWSFLVILILVGLASAAWITPVGPAIWGFAWLPTLLVILIAALLLAAATPTPHRRRRELNLEKEPEPSEEETAAIAIGGFFWILLLILLGIAFWGIWI